MPGSNNIVEIKGIERCSNITIDVYGDNSSILIDNVKYFVTDLWETYKDIAFTYFRKAKIVADHFHFARYACDAINNIRIEVQKKLPDKERRYFKCGMGTA